MHVTIFTNQGSDSNIKMSSYQYRKSHCGDKTILRPSYLHNGISFTGKMTDIFILNQGPGDISGTGSGAEELSFQMGVQARIPSITTGMRQRMH